MQVSSASGPISRCAVAAQRRRPGVYDALPFQLVNTQQEDAGFGEPMSLCQHSRQTRGWCMAVATRVTDCVPPSARMRRTLICAYRRDEECASSKR